MSFEDKTITCRDCAQSFVWTAGEQEFFQSRGFEHEPVRCRDCRNTRKKERNLSGSNGGNGYTSDRGPREMFRATCDECGKQTEVPFQPTSGKPLYCSDCFEKRRGYRGRAVTG